MASGQWACPDCGKINDNERDGMRCACGFGGELNKASTHGALDAPQINHAEVCGHNPLYQEMMRRARELQDLPREELVRLATSYSAEFEKKISGERHDSQN